MAQKGHSYIPKRAELRDRKRVELWQKREELRQKNGSYGPKRGELRHKKVRVMAQKGENYDTKMGRVVAEKGAELRHKRHRKLMLSPLWPLYFSLLHHQE